MSIFDEAKIQPDPKYITLEIPNLDDHIRAVVQEMDRESLPSPACEDCSYYHAAQAMPAQQPAPDLAERLAAEAVERVWKGGSWVVSRREAADMLLPLFQKAVRGDLDVDLEKYLSDHSIKSGKIARSIRELLSEVNCRREHGASGGEHLEYIEGRLKKILRDVEAKG